MLKAHQSVMGRGKDVLIVALLYFLCALKFSESTFQVEIFFKEFDTTGSRGRDYMRKCCTTDDLCNYECFFKFQICYGLYSLECVQTQYLSEKIEVRKTEFPHGLSGNLSNPLTVMPLSLKESLNLSITVESVIGLFNKLETQLSFDSIGSKEVVVNGGLNPRSPNSLSFLVSLNCSANFKPPECVEKICIEKDDDENGHYTCDTLGNIICREGWKDPSKNCRLGSSEQLQSTLLSLLSAQFALFDSSDSGSVVKVAPTSVTQFQQSQSTAFSFSNICLNTTTSCSSHQDLNQSDSSSNGSTVMVAPSPTSLKQFQQTQSAAFSYYDSVELIEQTSIKQFQQSQPTTFSYYGSIVTVAPTSVKQFQQFQSTAFLYYGSIVRVAPSPTSLKQFQQTQSAVFSYYDSVEWVAPTSIKQFQQPQLTALSYYEVLPTTMSTSMSSSTGCTSDVIYHNSTGIQIICRCNKDVFPGTNLTECYKSSELSIVSFVGCINSAAAIFLTIITYILFRNLQTISQKIFINLCFSMLFLIITFLIGIKRTNQPRTCHAVSVLLHYFTLTTFGWMTVEFLSMYRNVFRLYQGSRFFWTMWVFTWGFSAVASGVTSSFTKAQFSGLNTFCYTSGSTFIAATIVPISCVVVLVVILFVKMVCEMKMNQSKGDLPTRVRTAFMRAILVGSTWLFGVLAATDSRNSLQWIFSTLSSLLGIYLFIYAINVLQSKKDCLPVLSSRKDSKWITQETKA